MTFFYIILIVFFQLNITNLAPIISLADMLNYKDLKILQQSILF